MARVARPGAWLALSVAGVGTARRFQLAWRQAMAAWAEDLDSSPSPSRRWSDDPIGAMTLDAVVTMALASGFEIATARLEYEPVIYAAPADYVADVAAYGYGIYLATVPERERADVWADILGRFNASEGAGPYVHDQYMIYLIARLRADGSVTL